MTGRAVHASSVVALIAAVALALASCVVERASNPGVPVRPANAAPRSTPPVPLPDGPVATPANVPQSNASIRLDLEPLGTVVYDGQALPLSSPDGRWLVTQSGEAPDWATILADDGAAPPNRTTLTIFESAAAPLKASSNSAQLPPGLMLGRAADNAGFLVEAPQRDGSRWIGKVLWASGRLDWLVKDANINAHATLTSDGTLLYTSRAAGETRRAVCLLSSAGVDRRAAPDASYAYPLVGDDPTIVFVPRQSDQGTELEAIRLSTEGHLVAAKFGASLYRRPLARSSDILLAHQMAITSPGAMPLRAGGEEARVIAPLVCLSPRHVTSGAFDAQSGAFEPLVPKSVAAIASPDPAQPGYFCTLADSLVFIPRGSKLGVAPANILSEPFVPRAALSPDPEVILFGPVRGSPDQLKVLRLHLTEHTK